MSRALEILQQRAEETIAVLGVPRPVEGASAHELETWVEWWRPSLETARKLPSDRIAYLRAGGWWPPVAAEQVARVPPSIVQRPLRPKMYEDSKNF